MRLSNDHDQEIIRSAIPDSSASTMSFLSSIGNGEAIAFGEAVAVPMRMVFERVSEAVLPRANSGLQPVHRGDPNTVDLGKIVMRMRHIDDTARPAPPPSPAPSHSPAAETYRPQQPSITPQMPSIDPVQEFDVAAAHRRLTDAQSERQAGFVSREAIGQPATPAAAPRHEMSSLRASLLKKPLSSLLKD
jgi:hypothetical protein